MQRDRKIAQSFFNRLFKKPIPTDWEYYPDKSEPKEQGPAFDKWNQKEQTKPEIKYKKKKIKWSTIARRNYGKVRRYA